MAKSTERKAKARASDGDVSQKPARRPTVRADAADIVVAPAQIRATEPVEEPAEYGADNDAAPSELEIARLAHDRFAARGRVDGYDVEDWVEAERELRRTRVAGRRHG